jgi:hypothetical protein
VNTPHTHDWGARRRAKSASLGDGDEERRHLTAESRARALHITPSPYSPFSLRLGPRRDLALATVSAWGRSPRSFSPTPVVRAVLNRRRRRRPHPPLLQRHVLGRVHTDDLVQRHPAGCRGRQDPAVRGLSDDRAVRVRCVPGTGRQGAFGTVSGCLSAAAGSFRTSLAVCNLPAPQTPTTVTLVAVRHWPGLSLSPFPPRFCSSPPWHLPDPFGHLIPGLDAPHTSARLTSSQRQLPLRVLRPPHLLQPRGDLVSRRRALGRQPDRRGPHPAAVRIRLRRRRYKRAVLEHDGRVGGDVSGKVDHCSGGAAGVSERRSGSLRFGSVESTVECRE